MKTNLEIAQRLLKGCKKNWVDIPSIGEKKCGEEFMFKFGFSSDSRLCSECKFKMQQHKEDCESFWKDLKFVLDLTNKIFGVKNKYISKRFEDLSATIKFYESKGIK